MGVCHLFLHHEAEQGQARTGLLDLLGLFLLGPLIGFLPFVEDRSTLRSIVRARADPSIIVGQKG